MQYIHNYNTMKQNSKFKNKKLSLKLNEKYLAWFIRSNYLDGCRIFHRTRSSLNFFMHTIRTFYEFVLGLAILWCVMLGPLFVINSENMLGKRFHIWMCFFYQSHFHITQDQWYAFRIENRYRVTWTKNEKRLKKSDHIWMKTYRKFWKVFHALLSTQESNMVNSC